MELSSIVLLCANFLFVIALPFVFFRPEGKWNLMWSITSAPFVIAPLVYVAAWAGMITPLIDTRSAQYTVMVVAGVALSVASICLMFLTLGTHRIPLALWHQKPEDDAPAEIVTWGAYARIRHPFYTSYLLAFAAGVLVVPHWASIALCAFAAVILNYTAAREERRLSQEAGQFGERYRDYMRCTGRFVPRLAGNAHAR
jgi:protein-S-isoprenylcysteine O-methyltransferase Ste14